MDFTQKEMEQIVILSQTQIQLFANLPIVFFFKKNLKTLLIIKITVSCHFKPTIMAKIKRNV